MREELIRLEEQMREQQAAQADLQRQLGTSDQLFWSIHELELRERGR